MFCAKMPQRQAKPQNVSSKYNKQLNMKKIIFILFFTSINAQNLVQNPSFETYSSCPSSLVQISRATHWDRPPNTTGTPDYFNTCATLSTVTVPNNAFGFQQPYEGNAYVGIATYYDSDESPREYIQTELSSTLIAGQTYYLSFYISLGESTRLASNNMGAVFSITPLNGSGNTAPITVTPHILNQNIITDTTAWTQISGAYVATGNEKFLTIGNFFDNSQTQSQISNPNMGIPQAYYYIDNVSVTTSLGQEDFYVESIKIIPNPVTDIFSIIGKEPIREVVLYSQLSAVKHFNSTDSIFNINDLPAGIYYLKVIYESDKQVLSKIIKK